MIAGTKPTHVFIITITPWTIDCCRCNVSQLFSQSLRNSVGPLQSSTKRRINDKRSCQQIYAGLTVNAVRGDMGLSLSVCTYSYHQYDCQIVLLTTTTTTATIIITIGRGSVPCELTGSIENSLGCTGNYYHIIVNAIGSRVSMERES